jgi:hypothetical protein
LFELEGEHQQQQHHRPQLCLQVGAAGVQQLCTENGNWWVGRRTAAESRSARCHCQGAFAITLRHRHGTDLAVAQGCGGALNILTGWS